MTDEFRSNAKFKVQCSISSALISCKISIESKTIKHFHQSKSKQIISTIRFFTLHFLFYFREIGTSKSASNAKTRKEIIPYKHQTFIWQNTNSIYLLVRKVKPCLRTVIHNKYHHDHAIWLTTKAPLHTISIEFKNNLIFSIKYTYNDSINRQ